MVKTRDLLFGIQLKSVICRMLLGALIGLAIISLFVFSVNEPNPDWGKYWRIRPLILTPIATAFGILSFYLKDILQPKKQFLIAIVYFFSCIAFFISLWLGIVLGLDGTLWD